MTDQGKRQIAVHIVERMEAGGIETLVLDLVRSSIERDRIFSLSGTADELVAGWPEIGAFRDRIEGFARPAGVRPLLIARLAKRLAALRPAAVIAHHIGPLVYGAPAARLAGVPRVIHVEHDAWHYDQKRRRTLLSVFSRACRVRHVAVSQQISTVLRQMVPTAAVCVIAPGVDTDRFRPAVKLGARKRLGLDGARWVVGSVGRLVKEKGHTFLVEALSRLEPGVHLAIVGAGPEAANIQKSAHALGLAGRVRLLGQRDRLEDIYPAFDVFCLPSIAEGLPRSILEAQACGIPVVASDVGGVQEAICRRSGILVPPRDARALAAALQTILDAQGDLPSPRQHVVKGLSLSQARSQYRALIEGVPC